MQFPIDIELKLLGWHADLRVTDASGQVIGFVPSAEIKDGRLPIYADDSRRRLIYTIRAEHPLSQWFEDAAGTKIGEFGLTPLGTGKFIFVEGEPRFRFVDASRWWEDIDWLIPSLPILNGLIGLFFKRRTLAIRIEGGPDERGVTKDGANVLSMVTHRMMIDIRYNLTALEELDARERECLVLSAVVFALQDHSFRIIRQS